MATSTASTTNPSATLPPHKTDKGGWAPQRKGELAAGALVDVDEREGGYGPYKIYTLAEANGEEIAVHAFHDLLAAEFAKWQPQWNERVEILYLGRGGDGGKNVTDPYLYRMRVPGRDPAPITYDVPVGPPEPEPPKSDVPAPEVEQEPDPDPGDDGDDLPF